MDRKKWALIAGVLPVGVTGTTRSTHATDRSSGIEADSTDTASGGNLALVPMDDHRPEMRIDIVSRLPAPIAVELLQLPNGGRVPVVSQPDEYTGYVVRSTTGDEQVDTTSFVFVRGSLNTDAYYEFEGDASVFSVSLKLLRVTIRRIDPTEGADADESCDSPG